MLGVTFMPHVIYLHSQSISNPLDFKSLIISSIMNHFLYSITALLLSMLVAKYQVSSDSSALHTAVALIK